jgi:hypothetical protein
MVTCFYCRWSDGHLLLPRVVRWSLTPTAGGQMVTCFYCRWSDGHLLLPRVVRWSLAPTAGGQMVTCSYRGWSDGHLLLPQVVRWLLAPTAGGQIMAASTCSARLPHDWCCATGLTVVGPLFAFAYEKTSCRNKSSNISLVILDSQDSQHWA